MTTDSAAAEKRMHWGEVVARPWFPLLAGLLILAVPTIISLGRQTWAEEAGAHGPIVLATGLWLLYHEGLTASRAGQAVAWRKILPLFIPSLALYVFGRAYDFISLEVLALYAIFIAFLLRLFGFENLKRWAFPLFYLAFMIPPPGWVIDRITAPLQLLVSHSAEFLTAGLGYPVARQGVTLVVAQYHLLVEDACAGMNSLFGLTAIGLFYIYMVRRASWRYALFLVALIIPVAIVVNIIRVLVLILITYHFGNAAAQGYMHSTTGLVLFGMALLIIFGIDMLAWRIVRRTS